MEIYFIFAAACGTLGYVICSEENKTTGAVLGALLGPIGLVIAVIMDRKGGL